MLQRDRSSNVPLIQNLTTATQHYINNSVGHILHTYSYLPNATNITSVYGTFVSNHPDINDDGWENFLCLPCKSCIRESPKDSHSSRDNFLIDNLELTPVLSYPIPLEITWSRTINSIILFQRLLRRTISKQKRVVRSEWPHLNHPSLSLSAGVLYCHSWNAKSTKKVPTKCHRIVPFTKIEIIRFLIKITPTTQPATENENLIITGIYARHTLSGNHPLPKSHVKTRYNNFSDQLFTFHRFIVLAFQFALSVSHDSILPGPTTAALTPSTDERSSSLIP